MAQYLTIHPANPQERLIKRAAEIIQQGGLVVYPTDSVYALGCHLGNKDALQRIRRIRQLDDKHNFTLVCRDLSEVANYAQISNAVYRLLKAHTPGPYTFILKANREVPRRLLHPKRRTIGLRIPDHEIAQALLRALDAPLMSTTLILPGDDLPLTDPEVIRTHLEHQVDLIIDGGHCGLEPTTIINLLDEVPILERQGKGDIKAF